MSAKTLEELLGPGRVVKFEVAEPEFQFTVAYARRPDTTLHGVERNRIAARRWVRAVRDNALLPFTWPTPHNQVKP